jgi:hypothetical protein
MPFCLAAMPIKEKKRRAFENRVLAAEKEPTKVYETAEQAMQAILNATEN